jgi:hypothetical protein
MSERWWVNAINDSYIQSTALNSSTYKRPHNASDCPHKALSIDNVTKSFNEIYEDLKNNEGKGK